MENREALYNNLRNLFKRTWSAISGQSEEKIFFALKNRYSEPHRHYHDLSHIAFCLEAMSFLELDDRSRIEIELAIWFHDVIYDVMSKENEVKSADFFQKTARDARIENDVIRPVTEMILATRTHEIPTGYDTRSMRLFLDIDLSILGTDSERFRKYDEDIRKEYSWVPTPLYQPKRKKALSRFLQRPSIFFSQEFQEGFEKQARENLLRTTRS